MATTLRNWGNTMDTRAEKIMAMPCPQAFFSPVVIFWLHSIMIVKESTTMPGYETNGWYI